MITEVLSSLEPAEKMNYNETKTMYEKFWSKCQDCIVFEVDKKFSLSIDKMEQAPKNWTIYEYKESRMKEMMHHLYHMPDPSVKQILCAMPDTEENSIDWEEIKDGKFFIINRQHNVAANKKYRQQIFRRRL